jgi:hypothetical protein
MKEIALRAVERGDNRKGYIHPATSKADLRLLHPATVAQVPHMSTPEHESVYPERDKQIIEFICLKGNDDAAYDKAAEEGCWFRVGDWVKTTFMGTECYGQLADLSDTFPTGSYTIMLYLPTTRATRMSERAMIKRWRWEFEPLNFEPFDEEDAKSAPTQEEAKELELLAEADVLLGLV